MKCRTPFVPSSETQAVAAWIDPLVEAHGFGPASSYVEFCWLPVLGPTTTWLFRRLAMPLLVVSQYEVDLVDLAVSLGLGEGIGRQSPLVRSFGRLITFGAACKCGDKVLVRRALPPLTLRQAKLLSLSSRLVHEHREEPS